MRHIMLAAALCVAGATYAGPLDRALLPPDPNIVAHLDLEALKASEIGKFLLDEQIHPEIGELRAEIMAETMIDPYKEIMSITAYCQGEDIEENIIIIHGTAAFDLTVERLEEYADEIEHYNRITANGRTLHHWNEPGDDEGYLCVLKRGDEAVVLEFDKRRGVHIVAPVEADE